MKIFIYSVLAFLVSATSVYSAELPFTFKILDPVIKLSQAVPHPRATILYDVNDKGAVLVEFETNKGWRPALPTTKGTYRSIFECPGFVEAQGLDPATALINVQGFSVANNGNVVGTCFAWNPDGIEETRTSGFIRGFEKYEIFDYPGSIETFAQGISSLTARFITGTFRSVPGRLDAYKCFLWDRRNQTKIEISYAEGAFSNCYSVNDHGQVLGQYIKTNDNNELLEVGYFIYDNGTIFGPLFTPTNGHMTTITPFAMNNDGALVIVDPDFPNQLYYYDDGVTYSIPTPAGWEAFDVGGLNNNGVFVGNMRLNGVDHGFIATPVQ